ncbi:MAG: glycosyl hydrolase [Gemmatimonadota bacterium]|nr:glycosyl hydrolase [Gemmatimonadota bacterium]
MPHLFSRPAARTLRLAFGAIATGAVATGAIAALPARAAAQGPLADSLLVRPLAFRAIGPASMSGRIADISVIEAPRVLRGGRLGNAMYVAVATGGVWKTTNGGIAWSPVSDSIGVGSIGAVAAAPSNGDVVWVGSGEANNMRSSSWGVGVFKSTDGGKTWSKPMLPKTQHIGRIVIDPRDPDIVYVAAMGPLWAPGGDRGLYKTIDGGKTWTNTKSISAQTGFTELVMDPANPDVLYAASLQRERREYGFLPGGTESAIWKTTDGAKTWTKLTNGLPTGEIGRIGLTVCRSRPGTVYASVHAKAAANGFYRSDDAGATWKLVNGSNGTAWYYSQVRCDPTDAEHVFRLNANSQESYDGGKTWTGFAGGGGVHGDAHALWINPEDREHIVLGNDGGVDISNDRGRTWYNVENIVGAQFYAIAVDDAQPFYNVYGGLQDNQTWGGPSRTRNAFGPSNADWYRMAGGDGFYNVPDPLDHNIAYAESQNGGVVRYDARTGQTKSIKPYPKNGERHRWNWSAPIVPSRHTGRTVYLAANHLFKSADRGDSWTTISPDLTRNIDRDVLPMRGAVPARDVLGLHEGTAEFSNISTVSESPRRAGVLAVGTDDGLIQVTQNDGKSWTKTATFPGVPDTTFVSRVQFSTHNEGTLYATFDGHRSNDFKPYVMRSTDFGRTWSSITGDLPDGGSVQVIREHHRQPNLLFVGTEFGAFFTVDNGVHWTQLTTGIPGVPVWDLQIQERWNDLVLGTHGRGVFILDDLSPLEHLAEAKRAEVAYLFPARNEIAMTLNGSRNSGMGSTGFTGQNPDNGVRLAYLINAISADDKATLEIIDAAGRIVRELPVPRRTGMFRPVWDMRVGAPLTAAVDTNVAAGRTPAGGAGAGGFGGGGFGGGFGRGATPTYTAAPGSYTVRLTIIPKAGARTVLSQRFALRRDTEQALSDGELKALDAFRFKVVQFQKAITAQQTRGDSVVARFAAVKKAAEANAAKMTPELKQQLADIDQELASYVKQVGQATATRARGAGGPPAGGDDDVGASGQSDGSFTGRAAMLNSALNSSFPVSAAQQSSLQSLTRELAQHGARAAAVQSVRLPALLKSLQVAGITVPDAPVRGQ